MRARTAALRPSPGQVYQKMVSLPMEKPGVARAWPHLISYDYSYIILQLSQKLRRIGKGVREWSFN